MRRSKRSPHCGEAANFSMHMLFISSASKLEQMWRLVARAKVSVRGMCDRSRLPGWMRWGAAAASMQDKPVHKGALRGPWEAVSRCLCRESCLAHPIV